jgi:hypothetical protein
MEAVGKLRLTDNNCVGIDLGSNKAVLAVVKKGGIDIVLTDTT